MGLSLFQTGSGATVRIHAALAVNALFTSAQGLIKFYMGLYASQKTLLLSKSSAMKAAQANKLQLE